MKQGFKRSVIAGLAAWVSACGGGGSSSPEPIELRVGDSFTYLIEQTPAGGSTSSSHQTETLSSLSGGQFRTQTYASGASAAVLKFSDNDTLSSWTDGELTCTRLVLEGYNRRTFPDGAVTSNQTWTYGFTDDCAGSGGSIISSKLVRGSGKIIGTVALETPAGNFDAIQYTVEETEVPLSGSIRKRTGTCWRHPDVNMLLGCDFTVQDIEAASIPTSRYQQTLVGYAIAEDSASHKVTQRFAGIWSLSFSGTKSGECPIVEVGLDGSFSTSCRNSAGAFTLTGSINAQGELAAKTADDVLVYKGTLSTPLLGAGNWVGAGSDAGAWVANHE